MDEKDLEKKEDTQQEDTAGGGTSNGDQEDSNQMQPMQGDEEEDSDFDALEDAIVKSSAPKVSVGGKSGEDKEPEEPSKAEGVEENPEQEQEKKAGEDSEKLDDAAEASAKAGVTVSSSEKEEDGEEEAVDESNSEITDLAVTTFNDEAATGKREDENDRFDEFKDLLADKRERTEAEEKNKKDDNEKKDDTPKTLRDQVEKYRKGNLYMAVVLAKDLEAGKSNPNRSSRASRFFNSSGFKKASDVSLMVGLGSGLLGSLDSQYAGSTVSKGISLVTNFMGMISSIKNFVQKIKAFKGIKEDSKAGTVIAKVFSVIGMISDLSMALSKGCAIAKTIAGFLGKAGGAFTKIFTSKIMNYVSLFLSGTSQIGGLLNASRGLMKAKGGLTKVSGAEGMLWKGVEPLEQKYQDKDNGVDFDDEEEGGPPPAIVEKKEEASEQPKEEEKPAEKPTEGESAAKPTEGESAAKPEGGAPDAKPEGGAPAAKPEGGKPAAKQPGASKEERARRRKIADSLLARDDLSDADKAKVMTYLAISRKYDNIHTGIIKGASGLSMLAVGFASSIMTGVQYGAGGPTTPKLNKLTKLTGMAASLTGLAANGANMGVDKHAKDKQSSETSLMQARLMGSIKNLQSDEYGLKGISNSLADPDEATEEKKAEAKNAVAKYAAADAMFTGVGVKYDGLFKAPNIKSFQNLLIADI